MDALNLVLVREDYEVSKTCLSREQSFAQHEDMIFKY